MNTHNRIHHPVPRSTSDKQLVKLQVTLNVGGKMEGEHLFSLLNAGIDREQRSGGRQESSVENPANDSPAMPRRHVFIIPVS